MTVRGERRQTEHHLRETPVLDLPVNVSRVFGVGDEPVGLWGARSLPGL
jgi:hypothetical protein